METRRPPCRCGQLAEIAADLETPFKHDAASGSYSLEFPTETIPYAFCFFCGGLADGPWTVNPPLCACGAPERWAADPRVPVEWGTIVIDAYGIRCWNAPGGIPIHFCPACGGRARDVLALAEAPHPPLERTGDDGILSFVRRLCAGR